MARIAEKLSVDIEPITKRQLAELAEYDGLLIRENVRNLAGAQQQVLGRLDDKGFVAGFGSNGGEEFLSYMNIGESLWLRGGEEWAKFDKEITGNLNRIQNPDGSWSGHHCITGRTFCTAAAVLTLTVDRSPAKQGRYLPGSRLPVRSPDHIEQARPDYVLILPWTLGDEIMGQLGAVRSWGGRFVLPLPTLTVVT